MPNTCTCGTVLVEDASFCHRCGKAQRELLAPEYSEPEPYVVPVPVAAPPFAAPQNVGFKNVVALRICFLMASMASLLCAVSGVAILFLLWCALAGFFAVTLYQRRTGQLLSVSGGAKMGWIVSVLNFAIFTVFSAVGFVADRVELTAKFRDQLSAMKTTDPRNYAALAPLIESQYGIAVFLVIGIFMLLGFFSVAGTAGGALGAKVGKKN